MSILIILALATAWAVLGIVPMLLYVTRQSDCTVEDLMFICALGGIAGPLTGIAVAGMTLSDAIGDKIVFRKRGKS
jgi:hypothetical protein